MRKQLANMPISKYANEKHKSDIPYIQVLKNAFPLEIRNKEQRTKSFFSYQLRATSYQLRDAKQLFNFTTFQLYNLIPYIRSIKNALRLCFFVRNRSASQVNFQIFKFSNFQILLLYAFTHLLIGCSGGSFTPKPAGYPHIDLPEKAYTDFQSAECDFSFRVPKYAVIEQDKNRGAEPCWFNISYPELNAKIHMSYKPVSSFKNFYEMSEDAHTFAYKHTLKAEDIYDSAFYFPGHKTSGFLFSIEGNTASALQFYATDSSKHYLRGALYFNAQPNKDSLQTVVSFIRADIDTLLKSLKWK